MAHLNLRDHRIEATIAYVGPEAHISSIFDRLRSEPNFSLSRERVLTWRPTTKRFRDCELHVTLVIGEQEAADGVVVFADRALDEELATLERTLADMLATLEAPPAAKPVITDGAHPLLTALRTVLEDTARAQVEELAKRLDAKDDGLALNVLKTLEEIDAHEDIDRVRDDIRTLGRGVDTLALRMQRFDALSKRIEKVEGSIEAINTQLTELIEELKKPKKSWFT